MNYTAIDGDISDFIDAMTEVTDQFSTDELRAYLINEGHPLEAASGAIADWQKERFEALDPSWQRFKLTPAGAAAVEQLRDSLD